MINGLMLKNFMWNVRMKMARKEKAIGVVEVILILLVLVGLVLIFKDKIVTMANTIFTSINSQVNDVAVDY